MTTPSTNRSGARPGKPGRSVPAIYGLVSLVLVVGAVTFALSTPPPSTPPLAAVAPAPQEQLEVERVEQSSRFGEGTGGDGDCAPGASGCVGVGEEEPLAAEQPDVSGAAPAGQDEPEVVETRAPAELRRCVHGPGGPRQTEDPQSPPCKQEIFSGDNGGATSTGVTRTSIRVAYPERIGSNCWAAIQDGDCPGQTRRVLEAFASHVNHNYELYGRSIELVAAGDGDASSPAGQRAFAADVAALEPFAVLGWPSGREPFFDELASRGIVTLTEGSDPLDAGRTYDRLHPYLWGVYPSADESGSITAELVCRALVDRPAVHGGPDVASTTRRFGVIQQVRDGQPVPVAAVVNRLAGCGADHVVRSFDARTDDRRLLVRSLQDDQVTTVVCFCLGSVKAYAAEADEIGYEPEWLLPGFAGLADGDDLAEMSRAQRGNVFGLVPGLREPVDTSPGATTQIRLEEQYWYRVLRDEDPEWEHRRTEPGQASSAYNAYAQLVLLASGIQWAGPDLTPETFAQGLQGQTWPNPGVGEHPWYQPAVAFGPSDHTFNSDGAFVWWELFSTEEEGAGLGKGRWCYVGDGARFTGYTIPADADKKFFDLEAGCR